MKRSKTPEAARKRRHLRLRKRIRGTEERPRLCVYRSLSHIYAQIIDDDRGHTLVAASDIDGDADTKGKRKSDIAKAVGELIGKRAKEQGIHTVVFDRGGFKYHGRVKAFAEGAREGGLEF